MAEDSFTTQVISGDGEFDAAAMLHFSNSVNLHGYGLSYAVVAVIGPQSSGKSTLFNHLFGTNFREMITLGRRSQTTKGIWIAKAVGIEPLTLVMDLEGTDSRERGEDDKAFEKQSALFALEVADIVLINMWCHDIGREAASNKPLQRTIFEAMMRMFNPNKKTLIYVIRDKSKTPFEHLEAMLREDIQMIWDTISKPRDYTDTPLSEVFNVEVIGLSSYHDKEEQFKEQCLELLSTLAVMRLDEETDNVKDVLFSALVGDNVIVSGDPLASNTWDKVPSEKTLITPIECKSMWKEFKEEMARTIRQAKAAAQEEAKEKNKRSFWANVAMICKGFPMFLRLIRDPYTLPLVIVEFLVDKIKENVHKWYKKGSEFVIRQKDKFCNFMEELKKRLIEFSEKLGAFIAKTFGFEEVAKYKGYQQLTLYPENM